MRDALLQIILRLRDDALKDKEGSTVLPSSESLYSSSLSVPPLLPSVQSVGNLGYDHRSEPGSGLGLLSSSSLYGYSSLQVS